MQGVFFRAETQEIAIQRGVAGWVRNCEDGSVESVFEGPADVVQEMVEMVRNGPGNAQIERAEVVEEEPEGLTHFQIR